MANIGQEFSKRAGRCVRIARKLLSGKIFEHLGRSAIRVQRPFRPTSIWRACFGHSRHPPQALGHLRIGGQLDGRPTELKALWSAISRSLSMSPRLLSCACPLFPSLLLRVPCTTVYRDRAGPRQPLRLPHRAPPFSARLEPAALSRAWRVAKCEAAHTQQQGAPPHTRTSGIGRRALA